MKDLKEKTVRGFFWSGVDRVLTQGITFVIGLMVARLLSPQDYGLVAMLTLFIALSNTLVDCGFSSALIRNIHRTAQEECTVFYANLALGVLAYAALYSFAPAIAGYYEQPQLVPIARVIGLTLLFNAFSVVQQAVLTTRMDFKTQTRISVFTNVLSGGTGLVLAYHGMGVWALVIQTLLASFFRSFFLWIWVKWIPRFGFSVAHFRSLFAYSSRILFSGLLDTGYKNLYLLVIGKYYTASSLGYYSRASQLAQFPSLNLTEIIQRVSFPALSAMQDEREKQAQAYAKLLRLAAFITFPLMIWLAVVAHPLIKVVLTDKWMDAAPLVQILALAMMWYPIHAINLNLLQVAGRSDLFLRLEIIKKMLSIGILLLTLPLGLKAMCWGMVGSSVLALCINTYYTGKLIGLGLWAQLRDWFPILLRAVAIGLGMWLGLQWMSHPLVQIFVSLVAGSFLYLWMAPKNCKLFLKEIRFLRNAVKPEIPHKDE